MVFILLIILFLLFESRSCEQSEPIRIGLRIAPYLPPGGNSPAVCFPSYLTRPHLRCLFVCVPLPFSLLLIYLLLRSGVSFYISVLFDFPDRFGFIFFSPLLFYSGVEEPARNYSVASTLPNDLRKFWTNNREISIIESIDWV